MLTVKDKDGFDYLPSANPQNYLGHWTVAGTVSRVTGRGGQGFGVGLAAGAKLSRSVGYLTRSGTTLIQGVIVGFGIRLSNLPSSGTRDILVFRGASTSANDMPVEVNSSGVVTISRGSTAIFTFGNTLNPGDWAYIEVQLGGFVNSGGYIRGYFNGISNGSDGSGGDTSASVASPHDDVASFELANESGSGITTVSFDDFYFASDDTVVGTNAGNVQVLTKRVVSNGGTNAWSPFGAGSFNYDRVDDGSGGDPLTPNATNNDTDVDGVETSTSGARELYTADTFGLASDRTVVTVGPRIFARTTGSTSVRLVTTEGASAAVSADIGLGSTYRYYSAALNSPGGGGSWTPAKLDSSKYGVERV